MSVASGWHRERDRYRAVVLQVLDRLAAGDAGDGHFAAKCREELEPLLDLWPHVLLVPTTRTLGIDDLVRLAALPVHPLGVVADWTWADGRPRAPLEFFLHDVDHARFKVREDLLARGIVVPDAYVDGSTLDATTGRHRAFVRHAAAHVDGEGWRAAKARVVFVRGLQAAVRASADRALAQAARWLLFELVHEKSLPLEPAVLLAALATSAHVDKLRAKCARGFFAEHGPSAAAVAALPAAQDWLVVRCREVLR